MSHERIIRTQSGAEAILVLRQDDAARAAWQQTAAELAAERREQTEIAERPHAKAA